MRTSQERGVTLVELLIVIIVVGILGAIAIPSYRNYMIRTQRTDATAALLRVSAAQEKFYLQNNRYADSAAELTAAPPAGLGIAGSERGWYQIQLASGDDTVRYTATATPTAGGPQASDGACASFTINEQGVRGATNSSNAANTDTCWR